MKHTKNIMQHAFKTSCINQCKSLCLIACMLVSMPLCMAAKDDKDTSKKSHIIIGIYSSASMLEISHDYRYKAQNNYYPEVPGDYEQNMLAFSYGTKAGYDIHILAQHGMRLYIDYMNARFNSNGQTLGTLSMHTIGLNADYVFNIVDNVNVFAGVGLAYNNLKTQYLGDMVGLGYSINVGAAYVMGDVEFEFRIRGIEYDIPEKNSQYLPVILNQQTAIHHVELGSPISAHIGINYSL